ncbi:choice-of-anchor I domain-containing protein, partial [Escherichia sp. HC-CC4]
PDGTKILVANEGEPRNGYGEDIIDPLGSVTIIWLNSEDPASSAHRNVGFEEFDEKREELVASGIMLTKGNLPSADLEPEYIACDNDTAYIT